MIVPNFEVYNKLDLITELNCWFELEDNETVKLICDALRHPSIVIKGDSIIIDGQEWIFRKGRNVIALIDNKETLIRRDDSEYVVDYVLYRNDEIYPIYLKNRRYIFNGEEYEKYISYLDKKVLIGKNKTTVILRDKQIDLESGIKYYISRYYFSMEYNNGTKVIDQKGSILEFNFKGKYLGFISSYGHVYRSEQGVIVSNKKGNIGICVDETYLIGEMAGGLIILCGDKLKQYYNTSWREIDRSIDSELSVNLNKNTLGILKGSILYVYDNDFNKMLNFINIKSFIFDSRRIHLLSDDGSIGSAVIAQNYKPLKVINRNNTVHNSIVIQVDENYSHDLSVKNGKIVEIKKVNGINKKLILIEPYEYRKGLLDVKVGNRFYTISYTISYTSQIPKIEFVSAKVLVASKGGTLIQNPDKNALLSFIIKYSIPTRSQLTFNINILNDSFRIISEENSTEKLIQIPLRIGSLEMANIQVKVNAYVDERLIASLEFLAPIEVIDNNAEDYSKSLVVKNSLTREIIAKRNNIFQWEEIFERPSEYQGIIFGKEGEEIEIDGEKIFVRNGPNLITISKDNGNYIREYLIIGVSNPIRDLKTEIKGNLMILKIEIDVDTPFEIFYGPHSYRGVSKGNNEIHFPIEPTYNSIKVRAFSHGFKWEVLYDTNILNSSLIIASNQAMKIREILTSFGIL
ncbi:hypothetical protein V6M85_10400 [Sulfolobus tengchongensis]|uniref:Uncharacterized protein n=1 Tax=Sulfolobus tengchongensis TaxID=207809 RepID=A0AAX4KZW9_9CREN